MAVLAWLHVLAIGFVVCRTLSQLLVTGDLLSVNVLVLDVVTVNWTDLRISDYLTFGLHAESNWSCRDRLHARPVRRRLLPGRRRKSLAISARKAVTDSKASVHIAILPYFGSRVSGYHHWTQDHVAHSRL